MAEKNTSLSPEALDFSSGLLSIQESPPARLPRAVMYAVAAFRDAAGMGDLRQTGDYRQRRGAAGARDTYVKIVQPADARIVQETLVKEGERVVAGKVSDSAPL